MLRQLLTSTFATLVALVVLGAVVRVVIVRSDAYACATQLVRGSPAIADRIGAVREVRLSWSGGQRLSTSRCRLTLEVDGERRAGRVRVYLSRLDDRWQVYRLVLDNVPVTLP